MNSKLLWSPSKDRISHSNFHHFQSALEEFYKKNFTSYDDIHRFSIEQPNLFWRFYLEYSQLPYAGNSHLVKEGDIECTQWFPNILTNYARAALFPNQTTNDKAIIAFDENQERSDLSFAELRQKVAVCQRALVASGVGEGDYVAAMITNTPEAVILFLACASIGAIFSSCSPDFGDEAAISRFSQIQPIVFVASEGYSYGGKYFDTSEKAINIGRKINSIQHIILIKNRHSTFRILSNYYVDWDNWLENNSLHSSSTSPWFSSLPFNHPLFVLYSSGTTGIPKAIVHRTGGVMLKHHTEHHLHSDIKAGDRLFYFTTCSWMMWNWMVSALFQGATIVLYDGSPVYPNLDAMWQSLDDLDITFYGTSASYLNHCRTERICPKEKTKLHSLKTISSTGSPLSPANFEWVYQNVKSDIHLASISGGTDIVGCFMLGHPNLPVYSGKIQVPAIGVDLTAFNEQGQAVIEENGELICRNAFPSIPLGLLNDSDNKRFHDTYFSYFKNVWRHGDLIRITLQEGIIIHGRSDTTLNPGGVRIGTSEIYRPLETIKEITNAIAVAKKEDGDERIWLFVALTTGISLDETLANRIRKCIYQQASPRHVPQKIWQVSDLPQTRNGKIVEIAVSQIINRQPIVNRETIVNIESLDQIAHAIKH